MSTITYSPYKSLPGRDYSQAIRPLIVYLENNNNNNNKKIPLYFFSYVNYVDTLGINWRKFHFGENLF